MEVLTLIFPVFAVIVTGYLFARFELLPMSIADALTQFVYYTAVPAILFVIIAQQDLKELSNWPFIAVYAGPALGLFILMFLGARFLGKLQLGDATMLGMTAIASNTGIIALPLLHQLFGEKAVVLAALANIAAVGLLLILIVVLELTNAEDGGGFASTMKHLENALMNPVVYSTVLGIAFAASPLTLPKVAVDYLQLMASALAPCALFAVGMTIKISDVMKLGGVIFLTSFVKLIVMPALVLFAARAAGLDAIAVTAAVIAGGVPTAKTVFILSQKYHQYEEVAAEAVSVSTALAVVTLMGWLILLSHLYPGSFAVQ
ncbi:MAG: AEC family transporter [Pseudomonadota bacterium]